MKSIERAVSIDASADRVWEVLTDFTAFPAWNPFVREISGELVVGGRLTVRISPPGGKGMKFRPRLLAVDPGRELRWLGRFLLPGLFDGEHSFVITPTGPATCRLVQGEAFSGLFTLMSKGMLEGTAQGFDQMNHALKQRAESLSAAA